MGWWQNVDKLYLRDVFWWGLKKAEEKRRRREALIRQEEQRRAAYDSATNRPSGELVAGIGMYEGQPALYETGGWDGEREGNPDRIDVYRGPNGPLADPHSHRASNDGGRTVDYSRDADGTVHVNHPRNRG